MPDLTLPTSFLALLSELRPIFTAPSFANFQVLVCGFVHTIGGHRISNAIRAAGVLARKHYCSYYRFFSHARWSLDELGLRVLAMVLAAFGGDEIELVLDDTLARRKGKKVALATVHADPVLRMGRRPFQSYGHVFVILAVHVRVPWLAMTGWALPFMFRLFEGPKIGGRGDAPSDQRRAHHRRRKRLAPRKRERLTDRKLVGDQIVSCDPMPDTGPLPDGVRPTKLQLATQMLILVAERFPRIRFRVLADHLYAGNAVLHAVHERVGNMTFVVRGRSDAALYELPRQRRRGQMGRPRVKGKRLPNPERWAARHPRAFKSVEVEIYGETVSIHVAAFDAMAYRSLPGRLLRYVIVKDPLGIYKTDYLISTDRSLTAAEIVAAYARRWPIERTIQDAKQKLGIEEPQTQLPGSVRRAAPFGFLLYSLVVLWYLTKGHQQALRLRVHRDAWQAEQTRPAFADMLAALRRCGWAKAFSDPAQLDAARSKVLVEYLVRVVAAA